MTETDDPKAKGKPGASAAGRREQALRAERLAAALRANLGRRKAAARAAPATADEPSPGGSGAEESGES